MSDKLPLILAGPIVRRVEPALACVWLALHAPRDVKLDIWKGSVMAGTSEPQVVSSELQRTIQVGFNLHIALVTVVPPTGTRFMPGEIYSYNLTFTPVGVPAGAKETLTSLKLLENRAGVHLALGYDEGRLPSFVLPPQELTDLKIVHGSCRKPYAPTPDAMVWIDDLIEADRANPNKRPHQLFLSGDQIYADDLSRQFFQLVEALGLELFDDELVPTLWPSLTKTQEKELLSVRQWFPAGLRKVPMQEDAMFSTVDGENHLITVGEFAAHYLLVWNGELWPKGDDFSGKILNAKEYGEALKKSLEKFTRFATTGAFAPAPRVVERLKEEAAGVFSLASGDLKEGWQQGYDKGLAVLREFRDGLPKVRRALANVPTYMMFDDHEITDDWFLSKAWRDRVMTSRLGRRIFRNGLLAFAVFQGWGNNPLALTDKDNPHAKLRDLIPKLLPEPDGGTFEQDEAIGKEIDKLFGFSEQENQPVARWHYTIAGPKHHVFVLDCRTQRGFKSRLSGPQNVAAEALKEQLSDKKLPPEIEVVLVVSSLTVLGPPVIDALLGPMLYRLFDLKHAGQLTAPEGLSTLPGLDPDAIEAWAYDDDAFEGLLARVYPFKRVVFLSGDVHFGTGAAMTYFKKGDDKPSRFAQFTSSGFKNTFMDLIANLERTLAFMQRVATEGTRMERLAWEKRDADLVNVPELELRPGLRSKLHTSPVLLPTEGWPDGARISKESDWSWRQHIVEDTRPDADVDDDDDPLRRPKRARPAPLFDGEPTKDVARNLDGVRRAAARHVRHLQNFVFGRRLLFTSNLGVVSFTRGPHPKVENREVITAIHQMRARHKEDQKSHVYVRHEVILDEGTEKPPTIPKKTDGGQE